MQNQVKMQKLEELVETVKEKRDWEKMLTTSKLKCGWILHFYAPSFHNSGGPANSHTPAPTMNNKSVSVYF